MTPDSGSRFGAIPGRSRARGRVDPVARTHVMQFCRASGAASSRPEALGLRRGARRRQTAPHWSCAGRSRLGLPDEVGLWRRSGGSDRRDCAGQLEVVEDPAHDENVGDRRDQRARTAPLKTRENVDGEHSVAVRSAQRSLRVRAGFETGAGESGELEPERTYWVVRNSIRFDVATQGRRRRLTVPRWG